MKLYYMKLYYTDHFELPLPPTHRFPMSKYRLLRNRIASADEHRNDILLVPQAATSEQLSLAHCKDYIQRVERGTLNTAEIRRIGFPWSGKMVERSKRSAGATLAAARSALTDRVSVNLAGGTHHAMFNTGEGYCVFNDAAVTVETLLNESVIDRAAVIDCDVHQGNGTAQILANQPAAFTFSIHGRKNFPLRKIPSDLDVELDDGSQDETYLAALKTGLDEVVAAGPFDLIIYLAGADPFIGDRLGRLDVTKDGLRRRDEMVFELFGRQLNVPIAIAMAGGYAPDVNDIVDIHEAAIAIAGQYAANN